MSEAPEADTFDADFEAARTAGLEDEGDSQQAENTGGEAEEGEGDPAPEPVVAEADKVTKRLRDTQRALKAERAERQKLNARLEALESGGGKAERAPTPTELLAMLREDDDDPIGQIQTLTKLAKQLVGQTAEEQQSEARQAERQKALNQISTTMQEYEDDFRDLNPDYDKAAAHFMQARAEELKDTGVSEASLKEAMQTEFAGIVSRAIQSGKDPAEIIYNMAKRRGFETSVAAAKVETIARGQAAAKTLSGGGAASGSLSPGKVAELSGAAFDAAFDKLRSSSRRAG